MFFEDRVSYTKLALAILGEFLVIQKTEKFFSFVLQIPHTYPLIITCEWL